MWVCVCGFHFLMTLTTVTDSADRILPEGFEPYRCLLLMRHATRHRSGFAERPTLTTATHSPCDWTRYHLLSLPMQAHTFHDDRARERHSTIDGKHIDKRRLLAVFANVYQSALRDGIVTVITTLFPSRMRVRFRTVKAGFIAIESPKVSVRGSRSIHNDWKDDGMKN